MSGIERIDYSTKQLYYKNAMLIYGVIPMLVLLYEYQKHEHLKGECQTIYNAMLTFKEIDFAKVRGFKQKMLPSHFDGKRETIEYMEVYLKELGYFEQVDVSTIVEKAEGIVAFVNSGIGADNQSSLRP